MFKSQTFKSIDCPFQGRCSLGDDICPFKHIDLSSQNDLLSSFPIGNQQFNGGFNNNSNNNYFQQGGGGLNQQQFNQNRQQGGQGQGQVQGQGQGQGQYGYSNNNQQQQQFNQYNQQGGFNNQHFNNNQFQQGFMNNQQQGAYNNQQFNNNQFNNNNNNNQYNNQHNQQFNNQQNQQQFQNNQQFNNNQYQQYQQQKQQHNNNNNNNNRQFGTNNIQQSQIPSNQDPRKRAANALTPNSTTHQNAKPNAQRSHNEGGDDDPPEKKFNPEFDDIVVLIDAGNKTLPPKKQYKLANAAPVEPVKSPQLNPAQPKAETTTAAPAAAAAPVEVQKLKTSIWTPSLKNVLSKTPSQDMLSIVSSEFDPEKWKELGIEQSSLPTIPVETRAKVPRPVRQSILYYILEKCVSIFPSSNTEAIDAAKSIEDSLYSTATSKNVYLNLVENELPNYLKQLSEMS